MYTRLLFIGILAIGCLFMSYKCTSCNATFKSEIQRTKHEVNVCEATNALFQKAVASRKRKQESKERSQIPIESSNSLSGTGKRRKVEVTEGRASDMGEMSHAVRFFVQLKFRC